MEGENIVLKIFSLKLVKLVFQLEKAEQILLILAVFCRTEINGGKNQKTQTKTAKNPNSSFSLPEMSLEGQNCNFCKL